MCWAHSDANANSDPHPYADSRRANSNAYANSHAWRAHANSNAYANSLRTNNKPCAWDNTSIVRNVSVGAERQREPNSYRLLVGHRR